MKIQKFAKGTLAGLLSFTLLAGCGQEKEKQEKEGAKQESLKDITAAAKKEGEVNSVGMPDSWANWVQTWKDIESKYGIKHRDTDMSSAEELAKFESEGEDATADIGDVGLSFGPLAAEKDLTQSYKPSTWEDIPDWAKDKEGHWAAAYQGTIAFITDKNRVKNPPKSWEDIEKGDFKVAVGDVMKANQAQFAVLAASQANGGDESDLKPGLKYFSKIAKKGRLTVSDVTVANLEKGEVDVAILWDFNALGYRDQIDKNRFDVTIPEEGSVISGYTTIINKHAKHPNAAKLTREYIFSDAGQANLARGYARPIRENAKLPEDAKNKLLPDEMYKKAKPVKDMKKWDETMKTLPQLWQEEVLIHVK